MKTEEQRLLDELYDVESRRVTNIKDLSSSPTIQDYPDAKKHQIVSFIKSGIRILGYILIPFNLFWAAGILVLSEVVGIIEELV
jgi:hypothetical protein